MNHLSNWHNWLTVLSIAAICGGSAGVMIGLMWPIRLPFGKHRADPYQDPDWDADDDEPAPAVEPSDEPTPDDDERWVYELHQMNQELVSQNERLHTDHGLL